MLPARTIVASGPWLGNADEKMGGGQAGYASGYAAPEVGDPNP